jgi:hypothetical protein
MEMSELKKINDKVPSHSNHVKMSAHSTKYECVTICSDEARVIIFFKGRILVLLEYAYVADPPTPRLKFVDVL